MEARGGRDEEREREESEEARASAIAETLELAQTSIVLPLFRIRR